MRKRQHALTLLAVLAATALIAVVSSRAVENEKKAASRTAAKAPAAPAKGSVVTYKSLLIKNAHFIRQKPDFCGEACVATVLRKLGQPVDQDHVFDQSGLDPIQARGCSTRELATTFTSADYAQHMMALKKTIPAKGFTVVIQHPFVVIGDESPAVVRRRAVGTVKWSVDKLKQAYFTKDPRQIIDIWLFKDKASYRKYTRAIFNDDPDTPFGYFSHTDQALIMNIATGGGTLVHEIVHPFVDANFPRCPSWFNEGLGSLYEQSSDRDGQIVGLTNWRLAGLKDAIGKKQVPSFKSLCSTTTHQFYRMDKGTNYAQARYLCYYLQEHGLLRKFYRQFHANQKTDPTGYNTLQAVLDREDMDKFKKDWEAYVMKLRF